MTLSLSLSYKDLLNLIRSDHVYVYTLDVIRKSFLTNLVKYQVMCTWVCIYIKSYFLNIKNTFPKLYNETFTLKTTVVFVKKSKLLTFEWDVYPFLSNIANKLIFVF